MQNKKVEIDGENIEVRQFAIKDLEEIFAAGSENSAIDLFTDFLLGKPQAFRRLLPLCTPLTNEEILKMGANDFSRLVMAMQEMNKDFFAMWRSQMIGLKDLQDAGFGKSATRGPSIGS